MCGQQTRARALSLSLSLSLSQGRRFLELTWSCFFFFFFKGEKGKSAVALASLFEEGKRRRVEERPFLKTEPSFCRSSCSGAASSLASTPCGNPQ